MELEIFQQTLFKQFAPKPELPVVVGVSGGADSLCLLHLLSQSGLKLIPAHLDHQLRPLSSQQALQLEAMLQTWDLEIIVENRNVGAFASRHKLGIEEAARICRYEFLFSLAQKSGSQAVLTAHHRDDQVETVLMHFMRGSGVDGLSGMRIVEILPQFSADIPIWRPLLSIPKSELLAYCKLHRLEPIEDESNLDSGYFRNRLRNEVIPGLEKVQQGFSGTVARNAEAIALDRQLLEELSRQTFEQVVVEIVEGQAILFDRQSWQELKRGLQTRMLIRAARMLSPKLRDLGFEVLKRVLDGIEEGKPRQDLKGNLELLLTDGHIILANEGFQLPNRNYPQLLDNTSGRLNLNRNLKLANGWELKAELLDRARYEQLEESLKTNKLHAWLNPSDLELPLIVRPPQQGERWSPLGMVMKRQKMSDFFVNQKVPQRVRANWPIVTSGGSVLWVAGLRIAQAWRLLGDETQILHLELLPPEGILFNP